MLFFLFFKKTGGGLEFQLVKAVAQIGARENCYFFCISDQIKFEYRYSCSGCISRIHKCNGKMGVAEKINCVHVM